MGNFINSLKNGKTKFCFFVFLFVFLIAIDQIAKYLISRQFYNSAFAFSLPVPITLIYLIYVLVLFGIVYYLVKNYRRLLFMHQLAWLMILAGAASNIGERILLGYVRDFIYITFYHWVGIYNLADGYIIIGILILFLPSKNYSN